MLLVQMVKGAKGVIDEKSGTVDCGVDGRVFASIMDLDNEYDGEEFSWPYEGYKDVHGERSESSEREAIVCWSACYVMNAT